jgi:hypothetical protein
MASKNLSTTLIAGSTDHPELHNESNEVVNLIDYDSLVAAGAGTVLKKQEGGLWAAGSDLQASSGTGWGVDMGYRFVASSGGSDTNDGLSPDTAMATLAAAAADLPTSGIGQGGTIILGKGEHVVNNLTISGAVTIQGLGRSTTRIKTTTNGAFGIKFTSFYSGIRDLQITDRSEAGSGINGSYALWYDGVREGFAERILFDGWADTYSGATDFDSVPACLKIEGTAQFADWMLFDHIRTRANGGVSVMISPGCNGWLRNSALGGNRESLWINRQALGGVGESIAWRIAETQFIGGGTGASDYSVRVDHESGYSGTKRAGVKFISCFLEISAATGDTNGFYIDLDEVLFDDMTMGVAAMGAGRKALTVDADGEVIFGPYAVGEMDPANDVEVLSGGSLTMWQPTDWTGP